MRIKPYKYLWWNIPATFLLLLLGSEGTLDITWHDTYFIVGAFHVSFVSATLLAVLGLVYWILREYKLASFLTILHVGSSLVAVYSLVVLTVFQTITRTIDSELFIESFTLVFIAIAILLCSQVVLIANVIVGLVRGRR